MSRIYNVILFCSVLLAACSQPYPRQQDTAAIVQLRGESWHEADRLFFNNPDTPEWKGADVANSVALGDGRILWVFGDTLLTQPDANSCERFDGYRITVHNSLGLQSGSDPTTARMEHFWGRRSNQPVSFFEPESGDDSWYWMGGVANLGDQVVIFLMIAQATSRGAPDTTLTPSCAGLDFEMLGWDARIATITPESPDQWQWRPARLPDDFDWHGILVGSSTVSVDDHYLYAWSSGPAVYGGNPVYVARWPLVAARVADLKEPQWYTSGGWKTQQAMDKELPTAIIEDGNNEISVSETLWPDGQRSWWWLQSSKIINSPLCYRSANSPFDFGECRTLMEPPELLRYSDSTLLVYAAKFHPALTTGEDGVSIATYVVNSCDLKEIQEKCDLYYPRFIKLRRQSQVAPKDKTQGVLSGD